MTDTRLTARRDWFAGLVERQTVHYWTNSAEWPQQRARIACASRDWHVAEAAWERVTCPACKAARKRKAGGR